MKRKSKKSKYLNFCDVFIENHAFKQLIMSAIEVYNRETNGILLGKKTMKLIKNEKKDVVTIKGVYPIQTEERKPSEVVHGNIEAFKRLIETAKSLKVYIIGGYHSHPAPYGSVRLSKSDVASIKEDISYLLQVGTKNIKNGWIEILLSIKRKEYKKPKEREWYICDYIKKLRCYVRTGKNIGWDVLLSAYWVYPKERIKDKKSIEKIDFDVKEVAVYVEWIL